MEATVVSLGKAVLDGALGYARSKAAEEVALQLGVEGDISFIADELEMMRSFLMTADEGSSQQKLLATWVKHVRDLAYNVEDSLMDFSLLSEKSKSWWGSLRTMGERRRIAKGMKDLRAKVEDVSSRNLRYRLINESSGSRPTAGEEQASIATAALLGINKATLAALEHGKSSEVDLHQLITDNSVDLRVMAVWGTSGELGKMSAIQEVYDDPKVLKGFTCRAWIRLIHPFNPEEFLRNVVWQFYENSLDGLGKGEEGSSIGANVLMKMKNMEQNELVHVFNAQVRCNSYLVVIDDISTIVEWHCIKKYFPDNKKQSRIIVSTQQVEIASLCIEKPCQVSELKQLSSDQTLHLFHKKAMPPSCSAKAVSHSNNVSTEKNTTTTTSEIQEYQQPKNADLDQVCNSTSGKKFDRSRTLALDDEELTGRETEKSIIIRLVGQPEDNQGRKVISIWGMGGIGKTTLARTVYQCQQLGGWKHAWATALRPFNPEVLLRNLAFQLQKSIQEDPARAAAEQGKKKSIAVMKPEDLKEELTRLLNTQNCLIVLDDILSTFEWDLVKGILCKARRIIVTTREKTIALHCSGEYKNMYSLEGLKDDAALDLFIKKIFKDKTKKNDLVPAMMEQARLILKKCDGLPLAISTIGGFLATKPKTAIEWKKLNDHVSAELEINPELRKIKTILMRSYEGLPYHLKSVFLYLSIFPEDHKIMWGRLVRRWIAEGYVRDMHGMTAQELGRKYFDELLDRSMTLLGEEVNHYGGKISSCQLHDMIREICISKAREENLVFTLEDGCCLNNTQGPIRHLVIGSNWKRDKDVLMSMLDLSHVRSLTVFGEWRSFFISDSMRFLRVLDLEDTLGLRDHHLDKIGQLLHLKYLSLRRCFSIYRLPDSLGNLRHLQTLDVSDTSITQFPSTFTKLRKLQHFHATFKDYYVYRKDDIYFKYERYVDQFMTCGIGSCGLLMSTGPLLLRPQLVDADLNRSDVVNLHRFGMANVESSGLFFNLRGVKIPRGIGKLKALQTLRHINIVKGKGKVALKELRELTQLRKLGVVGVTMENSVVFWSALAGHNQLRSLSAEVDRWDGELDGCLGEGLSPPSCLESLKLHGKLVKMTSWIHQLHNLSKLTLEYARLEQDDAIQALGVLPNLAVLRLKLYSFDGKRLLFQNSSFPSLVVLELYCLRALELVLFEEDAMPRLQLLHVDTCMNQNEISGLRVLTSLREIRLGSGGFSGLKEEADRLSGLKAEVQRQVAEHVRIIDI